MAEAVLALERLHLDRCVGRYNGGGQRVPKRVTQGLQALGCRLQEVRMRMEGIQMDFQDKDLPKRSLGNDQGLAELQSEEK